MLVFVVVVVVVRKDDPVWESVMLPSRVPCGGSLVVVVVILVRLVPAGLRWQWQSS